MGFDSYLRSWPAAAALLLCTEVATAAIALTIEGVEGELEAAVRKSVQLAQYADRTVSVTQVEHLLAQAPEEAAQALEAYGYYHAAADAELSSAAQDGEYQVLLRVRPGEPVIVREVRLDLPDEVRALPAVTQAIEAFRPAVGDRLEHGVYERSKNAIATAMRANGYFDAAAARHRVAVTAAANSATVELGWEPGQRYRFGEVHFPDTQFSERFLRRYLPWQPDEFYSADKVLELQQRLVDADYFSVVAVQPEVDNKGPAGVPIDVALTPDERTVYTAGAYVSTDSGPGVKLGMRRRWLNDRGHKIGGEIEYSQRLEAASVFYRIPRPGERNRSYNFAAGFRDEETDTSRSRTLRLSAAEILDNWHGYTRTLGLQYLNGDFTIADEDRSSSLLFAEATLSRKRIDDLLFPSRALSVNYTLRSAYEGLLSDTSLLQARTDAKWVRPAGERSRLILRGSLGAMTVGDFDALPPELRFFAGGDRSIRGFDYQQIGETNASGGVIGGRYLTVASVEYEHYFLEKWGAAAFVDAGDAYSSSFSTNVGAGIGLRWRSPVGIVRLDVAVPVESRFDDDDVRFHIVIGPDL